VGEDLEQEIMRQEIAIERLLEALVNGDRPAARAIVSDCLRSGLSPADVLSDLFWPAHEHIERLHRSDQMTIVAYHLSTRLLRMLVDQVGGRLSMTPRRGQTIFAACGPSQNEELAAQMACDLLEAAGFDVTFAGGGIPGDEILEQVQGRQPDYLVLFASAASDLPEIRRVIDTIREIGACRRTKVIVGAGVFNRADGLAQEIGADECAYSPLDLVDLLTVPAHEAPQVAERQSQPGRGAATRKTRAAA
jgi:methanogenic corrinoid protein MtbC1